MKKSLLLAWFLLPTLLLAQSSHFNTKAEFEKLFGGYWDGDYIVWKPDFEASLLFERAIWSDGKCRSRYHKQIPLSSEAFVLVFYAEFEDEMYKCHFCGTPVSLAYYTWDPSKNKWTVSAFNKFLNDEGFYGEPNRFSAIKFCNRWFLVEELGEDHNMGLFISVTHWYSIERNGFHKVFSYLNLAEQDFGRDDGLLFTYQTEVMLMEDECKIKTILSGKEGYFDDFEDKAIEVFETTTYRVESNKLSYYSTKNPAFRVICD